MDHLKKTCIMKIHTNTNSIFDEQGIFMPGEINISGAYQKKKTVFSPLFRALWLDESETILTGD
jgi:hypothetical protein